MASADTASIVPPQNLEAEESVLGAMMVSEAAIEPVILDVRLRRDDFYRERHRTIYKTILELRESDGAVDVLTVSEALAQRGELDAVGGRDLVSSLAARVPAAGNARHYARIVKQNALMRRLDAAAKTIQQSVAEREGQPNELVENAERLLFQVAHEERAADFKSLEDVLHTEWDRLQLLHENKTELIGAPSGFKELDDKTGGFQKNNLVVIAARPSMGKSTMVTCIAENAALKHGKTVALFSLEMSESELAQRFLASQARISSDRLRKGTVSKSDWPKVVDANNRLAEAPLWIDDSSDLGLLELRAKARRLAAQEHGAGRELGLIIVDYLQLIRADDPRANRVEQVGQFSRGLKLLSGELGVPVIGVSQLSRAPEQRPDKRPILSDLRESGCLTGDSRVWLPDEGRYAEIKDLAGRRGFRALALNPETQQFERREVSNAFSTGTKRVFRLSTATGRTIRATANHKFLTSDGWRRLDELEPGQHLALPRQLDGEAPQPMALQEASLLGLVLGDGVPRHAAQLTARVRNTAQLAARLASDVFAERLLHGVDRARRWYRVYLAARGRLTERVRNPVAEWLEQLGGFALRSSEKRVPDLIFGQSEEVIASFLRHLWAADGCVWLDREGDHRPRIYLATGSAQLARDVQSLLLRIGINASRRVNLERGRAGFQVEVSGGPNMCRFLCVVAALDAGEQIECEEMLEYLEAQPAAQPSPRQPSAARARRRVAAAAGTPELGAPAAGEVHWDRIESIELAGVEEVFDLTVPGLHNFIADDIVVHNSIEQDADLVMFLYRDEYYNPESEDQGIAELHLAKHRNGPIGTVKLVFLSHYPKFANLTRTQPPVEQSSSDGSSLPDLPDIDQPDAEEG